MTTIRPIAGGAAPSRAGGPRAPSAPREDCFGSERARGGRSPGGVRSVRRATSGPPRPRRPPRSAPQPFAPSGGAGLWPSHRRRVRGHPGHCSPLRGHWVASQPAQPFGDAGPPLRAVWWLSGTAWASGRGAAGAGGHGGRRAGGRRPLGVGIGARRRPRAGGPRRPRGALPPPAGAGRDGGAHRGGAARVRPDAPIPMPRRELQASPGKPAWRSHPGAGMGDWRGGAGTTWRVRRTGGTSEPHAYRRGRRWAMRAWCATCCCSGSRPRAAAAAPRSSP